MKGFCISFVILIIGLSSARVHCYPTFSFYHHGSLDTYIREKLKAIVHWLDSRPDSTVFDYIYKVNEGAGLNLYQGDIEGYNPKTRSATIYRDKLWNTRVIPYVIDQDFVAAEMVQIYDAIEQYHDKTCLHFVPRTSEVDYIRFIRNDGCYSGIGRKTGEQNITLHPDCLNIGSVIHEVMHALGFYHEQSRPDRDSWVNIIKDNIQPGKELNFDKQSSSEVDTLGIMYDYNSLMHYSKYAFTKNGNPTLLPSRLTLATLGQRVGFSDKDIKRVNKLYRCDIPNPSINTQTTTVVHATTPSTTQTTHAVHTTTPKPVTPIPSTTSTSSPVVTTQQHTSVAPVLQWSSWTSWSPCDLTCIRTRYRHCFNTDRYYCPGPNQEIISCDQPCRAAFSLGCWKYVLNVIPSVEGLHNDLLDDFKYRNSSVRKCADSADRHGYMVFAITNHGQCLTGSQAHRTFDNIGPSDSCSETGDGSSDSMNVYTFERDIDGGWSPWQSWGQCERLCGVGRRHRYRACVNPPRIGSGAPCVGSARQSEACNKQPCPVNAKCGTKFFTGEAGTSGLINLVDYENYMECEYQIMSGEPDTTISVSIDRLDLEKSSNCIFDAIMVYDGPDMNSSLLAVHCGSDIPAPTMSSSNSIFLQFKSDETVTARGFTISYSINGKTRKSCTQPTLLRHGHGSLNGTSNFAGDTLTFTCEPGFHLVGPSTITCVDQPVFALWSDVFPYCIKLVKRSTDRRPTELCDFETHLCGFSQAKDDDFNWSLDKSPDNKGNYMSAKTSRYSHYGDKAVMISKLYEPNKSGQCLKFRYNLKGEDNSKLNVLIKTVDGSQITLWNEEVSWKSSGSWENIHLQFTSYRAFRVSFEFEVGEKFGSEADIDDVFMVFGSCR